MGVDEESEPESESEVEPFDGTPEEAAVEAISEIRSAIEDPEMQAGGVLFVPYRWARRYKHVLGPYQKFIKQHPEEFRLEREDQGMIVVDVRESPTMEVKWKSWVQYCNKVPKA